ncbi:MAG: aldo/keto reductase [Opitutales bacterium]|jgi:voltage-dependent potassium channel beta subunit
MDMEYRNLGKSGLQVSALSFGAWLTFGDRNLINTNEELMRIAYDAGVNFFDNAEGYASGMAEEVMGDILQHTGWQRDSYLVSSKVFFGADGKGPNQVGLSRKHVVEACHAALKRLKVDYLDLYYCHRPDPKTPVEETVWAMNDLIRQGKVLYWGTSEWSAEQIARADSFARDYRLIGPTMEQPQYNLLRRRRFEEEYAPVYDKPGIGTTTWSPLASGLLTGKYNDGIPTGSRLDREKWLRSDMNGEAWKRTCAKLVELGEIAAELGVPQSALAIGWCLKNPRVSSVILGATRPPQLKSNLLALDAAAKIDATVKARLDALFPVGYGEAEDY